MAYRDVRDFIAALERTGDVVRIARQVDWDLELGAVLRRSNELWAPAPFFEDIRGYGREFRALGGPISTYRRMSIALGLPPETPFSAIVDAYRARTRGRVRPRVVEKGACQEVVLTGEDVDLTQLPAPVMHGGDGGRYVGSWNFGVTRDLASDWVNWGTYRLMIHDKNTLGVSMSVFSHGFAMYQQYEAAGVPMPYAAVIGGDPCLNIVASSGVPYGVDEAEVAGALRGEPVDIVKCRTNDLHVPADAEIVIEGELRPAERRLEGPHGEYGGYQTNAKLRPVVHVSCITRRRDPILTLSCTGMPPEDWHILASVTMSLDFREVLEQAGVPIRGVFVPPQYSEQICIVSVDAKRYPGIAEKVASCVWSARIGIVVSRVFVVDADCDPTDLDQVWHAFATKCHPVRGTSVRPRAPLSPLTPFLWPEERAASIGPVVVYDCTWPGEWAAETIPTRVSFEDCYPKDVQEVVLERWSDYGFRQAPPRSWSGDPKP